MTATTIARQTDGKRLGRAFTFPMGAVKIVAGTLVMLSAGYATPAVAASGNMGVIGIAGSTVDNSGGSAGDLTITVYEGTFLFVGVSLAQTDVGKPAYASDNQTFSTTQASNEPAAGKVAEYVSATSGWIDLKF